MFECECFTAYSTNSITSIVAPEQPDIGYFEHHHGQPFQPQAKCPSDGIVHSILGQNLVAYYARAQHLDPLAIVQNL